MSRKEKIIYRSLPSVCFLAIFGRLFNQLMVNWFFGFLISPSGRDFCLGVPDSNPKKKYPNHQLTINYLLYFACRWYPNESSFRLEDDHQTLVGKTNNGINNHYEDASPIKNGGFPAQPCECSGGSSQPLFRRRLRRKRSWAPASCWIEWRPCWVKGATKQTLGGGFKDFLCSPLFGEDSHVD